MMQSLALYLYLSVVITGLYILIISFWKFSDYTMLYSDGRINVPPCMKKAGTRQTMKEQMDDEVVFPVDYLRSETLIWRFEQSELVIRRTYGSGFAHWSKHLASAGLLYNFLAELFEHMRLALREQKWKEVKYS